MQRILSYPRLWLVFVIVVVLFAVTGPFGTFDRLPFHARLGYWLSIHALAFLTAIFCSLFFNIMLADRVASVSARIIIGAAFAALPIGFIVMALTALFLGADISLATYGINLVNAVPVSIAVSLIVHFALDGTDADPQPQAAAQGATAIRATETGFQDARPRLLDRIPLTKRGVLIRLEVEDHYVRAITDKGSEMLLMRLADAIAEAGDGRQAHRSHWVSVAGAQALEREAGKNGRLFLHCADGARVPVSRGHAAAIQDWMRAIGRAV
jgi:DNA-binding LytR/AlgR family response regulator